MNTVSVDTNENVKGWILFTFSCNWSKLKSPRSNIVVTFTVDWKFSASCIKSVMKMWIALGGL